MTAIDVSALAHQVQSALTDPYTETTAIGTPSPDSALALLGRHQRVGEPLATPHVLGFWYAPPNRTHARD